MRKVIIILLAIFETIFYTLVMVLLSNLRITNNVLIFIINVVALLGIGIILYSLYRFILKKLTIPPKPYLYYVGMVNFLAGILFPLLLILLIPNENINLFGLILFIATLCYGIFVNLVIFILNHIFSS